MSDEAKVVLGYIHNGSVTEVFLHSVLGVFIHDQGKHISTYSSAQTPYVPESRCRVVEEFLQTNADWLWFLDTDVRFAPDTLDQLLAVADPIDVPIVAAAYWNHYGEGRWVTWLEADEEGFHPFHEVPEGLTEVSAVGMGCTLIHRNVLTGIQERNRIDPWPWFGNDMIRTPDGLTRIGEDLTFCVRAKQAGFPTHGLGITVEHLKPQFVEPCSI